MTIWRTLSCILPRNREDKWPLWVQGLAFVLIEVLFLMSLEWASALVTNGRVLFWVEEKWGMSTQAAANLLTLLVGTEICAWRMGLQRVVPFGANQQRRWTILPVTLWFLLFDGGAMLLTNLLLQGTPLPVLTENLLVYRVLAALMEIAALAVMALMVAALRNRRFDRALMLAGLQVLLLLMFSLQSAMDGQIQNEMLMGGLSVPQETQVYVVGDADESLPGFIPGIDSDDDAVDVVVISSPWEIPESPMEDAYAAYQERMTPVIHLSRVLAYLSILPMFFIFRKWIFTSEKREDNNE